MLLANVPQEDLATDHGGLPDGLYVVLTLSLQYTNPFQHCVVGAARTSGGLWVPLDPSDQYVRAISLLMGAGPRPCSQTVFTYPS